MAYREFTDPEGRNWRVWDTYPTSPNSVPTAYRSGWLAFEREGEKRRVAPIPPGWETMRERDLYLLVRIAAPNARSVSGESG